MASGIHGIVVYGVPRSRSTGQAGGSSLKPDTVNGAVGRSQKDIIEHGHMRDGVLQVDVGRHIDAEVAIEGIVVNRAADKPAAILAPDVNGIVMIEIGG